MKRIVEALFVAAALVASPALAHEHGGRAMGVVQSITPDRIVVKTSDGHEVPYQVTKETRFMAGDKPGRAAAVRVGQRVVVHGERTADGLHAIEVKFAAEPARK
jgi:hypothetical protein